MNPLKLTAYRKALVVVALLTTSLSLLLNYYIKMPDALYGLLPDRAWELKLLS